MKHVSTTPHPSGQPHRQPVQSATSAPTARREDRDARMRKYTIAMVVRTISFPLAVWAFLSGWVIVGWILMLAAVVLPAIAVGIANTVDERRIAAAAKPVVPEHVRIEQSDPEEAGRRDDHEAAGEPTTLVLGPEDIVRSPARPPGPTSPTAHDDDAPR